MRMTQAEQMFGRKVTSFPIVPMNLVEITALFQRAIDDDKRYPCLFEAHKMGRLRDGGHRYKNKPINLPILQSRNRLNLALDIRSICQEDRITLWTQNGLHAFD